MLSTDENTIKTENTTKLSEETVATVPESNRSQIIVIIAVTILISMVSGIHRFLISLLNNLLSSSSTNNLYSYVSEEAPLILWLTLAFTIAPFGLTKAITDYFSGSFTENKKVLKIGTSFYIGGVVIVIILLLLPLNSASIIFLPLASGFIGAGEGFFFASSQILLSKYATGGTRGRYLGFSEFSIYSGYTIGSLTAGFLSSNLNFSLSYAYSLILVFFTIVIVQKGLREETQTENVNKKKNKKIKSSKEKSSRTKSSNKTKSFNPKKLLGNNRILTVLVGSHFSKWGDALILLLPVYFAYLFSLETDKVVPDTVKIGFLLGVYTASWAMGMFITSYLTELVGRKAPIVTGFFISGIGFFGLSLLTRDFANLYILSIMMMLLAGIGTGFYYPLLPALGLDIAKPKYRGQTLALFRTFRDFGYFTGPICLILLVYVSGSSIIRLNYAIAFTGILMIVIGGFFSLILRETRPIWPFFEEFVTQVMLIKQLVKKSAYIFDPELMVDFQALEKAVKGAKMLEQKADKKKRQLYKDILLPMGKKDDINDFVELVELTDKIGNHASMAGLKYSKLYSLLPHVPKPLLTALRDLAQRLPIMMEELLNSIIFLNETASLTVKQQKIISNVEREIDNLYGDFLKLLYQFEPFYIETEKFTLMMTLKESSELLEQASDLILVIGDNLSMIALKHRL